MVAGKGTAMSDCDRKTAILLWFSNDQFNEAARQYLETSQRDQVEVLEPLPRTSDVESVKKSLEGKPDAWVWTDVSFEPSSHRTSTNSYLIQALRPHRVVFFVWNDMKLHYRLALDHTWKDTDISLPVSMRCPARGLFSFHHSIKGTDDPFATVVGDMRAAQEECFRTCRVSRDPDLPDPYNNWEVLLLDDQVLTSGWVATGAATEPGERFKAGRQGDDLMYGFQKLISHVPGTWYLGGTEDACRIACMSPRPYPRSPAALRDAVYGFDNYDLILLDVLFDLRMATDIQMVPAIRSATSSPLFVFSSAGAHGTHGESSLYYANRALRLGATGFISKVPKPHSSGRRSAIAEAEANAEFERIGRLIRLNQSHHEWRREWEERFQGSVEAILGDDRSRIQSILQGYADTSASGSDSHASEADKTPEAECQEKLQYIVCKLFEDYETLLFVREPSSGVGAGSKFFVAPVRNGRVDNPKLVKVGLYQDLLFEARNYEECIEGYLDTFVGQVARGVVRAGRYCGVVYSSVGFAPDQSGRTPKLDELGSLVMHSAMNGDSAARVDGYLDELNRCVFSRLYRDRCTIGGDSGIALRTAGKNEFSPEALQLSGGRYAEEALNHLKDRCGIGDIRQWWRKEYLGLLPPGVKRLVKLKGIKSVPPERRTADELNKRRTAGEPNNGGTNGKTCAGRLLRWSQRETAHGENTRYSGSVRLLDPFSHRTFEVEWCAADEDPLEKLLLRYGKWIEVTWGEAKTATGPTDELRKLLKRAIYNPAAAELRGKPYSEGFRGCSPAYTQILKSTYLKISADEVLNTLDNLLQAMEFVDPDPNRVFPPMTLSTAHGDLNLGNVLVGSDPSHPEQHQYWLIDFEKTHLFGHLAYDFAALEQDIRCTVVARLMMDIAVRRYSENGVRCDAIREALSLVQSAESALNSGEELTSLPRGLTTAYRWIAGLRRIARQDYGVDKTEQLLSNFLFTVGSIKFGGRYGDPAKSPTGHMPRILLLIAADAMRDGVDEFLSGNSRSRVP